eukprot:TRINITY_DN6299_c0_g1_i1.p1 TRINITY_DN6299_c0_g1~~TRINITY_DN6299_c0_g1_i1.p1  ORF type:complete len:466 (+),score=35.22 TRINITY_DN6299_c0_g1_i1:208-1605(+)
MGHIRRGMTEHLDSFPLSADDLSQILQNDSAIIVDVRSSKAYQTAHIRGALGIRSNAMLIRRLNRGTLQLNDLILDPESVWISRAENSLVVLYDDDAAFDGSIRYDGTNILHASLRSLQFGGTNCVFLHGGFRAFSGAHPGLVIKGSSDILSSLSSRQSQPLSAASSRIPPLFSQGHSETDCCQSALFGRSASVQQPMPNAYPNSFARSSQPPPNQHYPTLPPLPTTAASVQSTSYPYIPAPPSYNQAMAPPLQTVPHPIHRGPYPHTPYGPPPLVDNIVHQPMHMTAPPLSLAQVHKLEMSKILPYLYLGSERDAHNLDLLRKNRISYILNVTTTVQNKFEREFQYQQLGVIDTPDADIQEYFEIAIAFIEQARAEGKRVLVHCQAGISRSTTIVLAYLMATQHKTLNDALEYVRRCRSIVDPNFGFMGRLQEFEDKLRRRGSSPKQAPPPRPGDMTACVPLWG